MPVQAIELVKKLMAKAGVTHDGELTADIPDEVATALDNNLLTIAAATNNHPEVKKVYFAAAYDGMDAERKGLQTELGLSEEIVREIESAGGSTKKMVALVKKIKEISDKSKPEDRDAAKKHAEAINDLNVKLAAEIEKQKGLKTEYDTQLKQIRIKQKLDAMTGSYKTMYDELPAEAKEAAITALLTKALQDSDADFTFDEKGNLSLMKKDGTNLFGENHTLVTPQSFIDKSLSKILKVTGKPGDTPTAPPVNSGQRNEPNTSLKAAIDESLQSYEAASKNGVTV